MSIEKNNASTTDNHITIKALSSLNGDALSEKVVLTSSGYKPDYLSNSGFYFMMRCEIPEDASGYLMGIKTSSTADVNNTFYIHYASGTITWKIGSSTYTHDWETGVHDIGWANGKPIYDNALVDLSATAQSGIHSSKMAICGVNTDGTFSFISSLTLYRVDMEVYAGESPSASSLRYLERFYLVSNTLINAMKIPEASLVCYNASGGAGTGTASGTITYGVQLDDLRYLTGSGYRDLMAIVCEDNSVLAETGADPADVATNGSNSYSSAFILKDTQGTIPLPTGYSVTTRSTSHYNNYEIGDLIYRRTPKWSIWNDSNKRGFWVRSSENRYFLEYNIFKDFNGEYNSVYGKKVNLLAFDGYNSSPETIHKPSFIAPSTIVVEAHNQFPCRCTESRVLAGRPGGNDGSSTSKDGDCIFYYDENILDQGASFNAGNLVPWNYNPDDLVCKIYGVMCKASLGDQSVLFSAVEKENSPLGSTSTDQIKNKYRNTLFFHTFNYGGGYTAHLMKLLNDPQADKSIYCNLALVRANTETPDNTQIVDVSRFFSDKTVQLQADFDPAIASGSTNYRMFLRDHSSTTLHELNTDSTLGPTLTDLDSYVGYYVKYNGNDVLVTNENKSTLGITAGTTIAYTSDHVAIMLGGGGYNSDDPKIYWNVIRTKYKPSDSAPDSNIILPIITVDNNNVPINYSGYVERTTYYASFVIYYSQGGSNRIVSGVFKSMPYSDVWTNYSSVVRYWNRDSAANPAEIRTFYYQRGAGDSNKRNLKNYSGSETAGAMMAEKSSWFCFSNEDLESTNLENNGFQENSSIVVDVYPAGIAPLFFHLDGGLHSTSSTLYTYFGAISSRYAIQSPTIMDTLDAEQHNNSYVYDDIALPYKYQNSAYTQLETVPASVVTLNRYRNGQWDAVATFSVSSGGSSSGITNNGFTLYIWYDASAEYSGYCIGLDGGYHQTGFMRIRITDPTAQGSSYKRLPGDLYTLSFAAPS